MRLLGPGCLWGASFYTVLLLVIIPKISIFYLLMQVELAYKVVVWCVVLSLLVGGFGGLNQASMKKLKMRQSFRYGKLLLTDINVMEDHQTIKLNSTSNFPAIQC